MFVDACSVTDRIHGTDVSKLMMFEVEKEVPAIPTPVAPFVRVRPKIFALWLAAFWHLCSDSPTGLAAAPIATITADVREGASARVLKDLFPPVDPAYRSHAST